MSVRVEEVDKLAKKRSQIKMALMLKSKSIVPSSVSTTASATTNTSMFLKNMCIQIMSKHESPNDIPMEDQSYFKLSDRGIDYKVPLLDTINSSSILSRRLRIVHH